jgi:hypothetical protein
MSVGAEQVTNERVPPVDRDHFNLRATKEGIVRCLGSEH